MSLGAGRIGRRGFWLSVGSLTLSCHINGYNAGSQAAVCVGQKWYGWWSGDGWAIKDQKPLKVSFDNGQEFYVPIEKTGTVTLAFVEDSGAAGADTPSDVAGRAQRVLPRVSAPEASNTGTEPK